jgi:membrane protein YqaA with SNARE-associated domain
MALSYFLVFICSLLVDLLPFFGPPAWIVMVFFQMKYGLNIWSVLAAGVAGSVIGRYILSLYMPYLSDRFINAQKKIDIEFIGKKISDSSWKVQVFVVLYSLVPLPTTPLFTAAGIAKVKPLYFVPAFIVGKFTSDMIMVLSGDYAAKNIVSITEGMLSWKSVAGAGVGIFMILAFLGIDWRTLIMHNRLKLNFNIWK